ncbi:MAG TPA: ribosome small subunit-dependent GTPase A [Verrucomicrobiales bacterium]|nr:ribosome small subunit-dependent GTPase A [Verrucomicrobiales bacterium]HRJ07625.1 ribosome small subunit-dependent GTPase A [Prosthecobacter sp.]HRK13394.1 ribosome small subunit-dependent GTPase A [Prosthecobacter sp.]
MTLQHLGWNETFAAEFEPYLERGWTPARVSSDNKISCRLLGVEDGRIEECDAVLAGKVYHEAETDAELPAVGDWVALDKSGDENVIRARLHRQSRFSRKAPGNSSEEQVIVANASRVVVVTDPGTDFNPRRLERYLALIARGGAEAMVVVNKSDLHPAERCAEVIGAVRDLGGGVEVCLTSVLENKGFKTLKQHLKKGATLAFTGSSGVGKSALINHLIGEEWLWTGEVNEVTGKGRHTTTARDLLVLPRGGILVDNPGIREVQMWTDEETLRGRFADIDQIAARCRHHDCGHGRDAGCAIRAAVEGGELSPERYKAFLKLEDEIQELRRRRKKRQMTLERRAKRDHKIKARNREDRREIEWELKPRP